MRSSGWPVATRHMPASSSQRQINSTSDIEHRSGRTAEPAGHEGHQTRRRCRHKTEEQLVSTCRASGGQWQANYDVRLLVASSPIVARIRKSVLRGSEELWGSWSRSRSAADVSRSVVPVDSPFMCARLKMRDCFKLSLTWPQYEQPPLKCKIAISFQRFILGFCKRC